MTEDSRSTPHAQTGRWRQSKNVVDLSTSRDSNKISDNSFYVYQHTPGAGEKLSNVCKAANIDLQKIRMFKIDKLDTEEKMAHLIQFPQNPKK